MINILFYLGGILTVFGLIGVINFVISKMALKIRDDNNKNHKEYVEHLKRVEEIWERIADILMDKQ